MLAGDYSKSVDRSECWVRGHGSPVRARSVLSVCRQQHRGLLALILYPALDRAGAAAPRAERILGSGVRRLGAL